MDASEADEGAQLLGLFGVPRARELLEDHIKPVHAARTVLSSNKQPCSSGLFDVYAEPLAAQDLGLDVASLPPAVQVHDLADDDDVRPADELLDFTTKQYQDDSTGFKQFQDDLSARLPWADVEDDNDPSGYRIFDTIAEEAAADADSQECRTQCGPSDNGFYNHARAVLSDVFPDSDDEACNVDAEEISSESLPTQSGLLPQPQSGPVDDCLKSFTSLGHVLDDVVRHLKDSTSHEGPRARCGPVPHAVPKVPATKCAMSTLSPLPLRGSGSPGTSPGGGMGGEDAALAALAATSGFSEDSQQAPSLSDVEGALGGSQHSPSLFFTDGSQHAPSLSDAEGAPGGSQHTPSLFDFEGFTIFDLDDSGCVVQESRQSASTAAAIPYFDVTGLKDSLAQLVVTASIPSASLDARYAALAAYSDATQQFDHSLDLFEISWTDVQTKGTQCGPLPQPGSSFSAISDISPAQYTPQELGTSQCGPLPQFGPSHIQTIMDNISAQYAPQMLEATRILPTMRTQCGPLPQPGSSHTATFPADDSAPATKGKMTRRNGKRRGKGNGTPD